MTAARLLTLTLLAANTALAQGGAGTRRVSGTVYDSIGRAPLVGAVVEIVMVESGVSGLPATSAVAPSFATITDSSGQFEVGELPSGLYAVGFQHQRLEALGLESPITPLDLRTDSTARLSLAIPGGSVVRAHSCPSLRDEGLLVGSIASAIGGAPLINAAVTVSWDELIANQRRLSSSHHDSKATSDSSGRFSLCGLPRESPLAIRVVSDGYRQVESEIVLPSDGVIYQEFRLPSPDSIRGNAAISLSVVDDSGKVMTTGRALIVSLGRRASIDSGTVSMGALPPGTWPVEIRAIGYQPTVVLVQADQPVQPTTTVRMERLVRMLDAVSIVERATALDRKVLDEIDRRLRTAGGSLITQNDLSLRNAIYAADGLRFARGFRTSGSKIAGRPFSQGGMGMTPCVSTDFPRIGEKSMAVYLDGMRVPFGLQGVNDMVRPEEILAIEAYPDVISAPGIWRTNDACAVVVFWTKR